jgi:hypothetical protein
MLLFWCVVYLQFVVQGCDVGCHLEVLLLATLAAGVQEQRQAWGVAGTSPPHTVLVR